MGRMSPHSAALLLIAHGTRDPRGAGEMEVLLGHVRRALGVPVEAAWLEGFAEPDAVTAVSRLRAQGAQQLVTLPFLLLGAGHAKTDVPAAVAEIANRFGQLQIRHARVLGLHPALFALARARLDAVSPPGTRAAEALLLTAPGSSDPDANGDLAKAARFLAETSGHRWSEIAFAGVSWPTADLALRRLHAAGVQRVAHFSWSLLAGLLERRVTGWLDEARSETGMQIVDAGRFGPEPQVAEAVSARYHEALDGDTRMNCDLCQYRLPLPGRESRAGAPSAGGTGERVHRSA